MRDARLKLAAAAAHQKTTVLERIERLDNLGEGYFRCTSGEPKPASRTSAGLEYSFSRERVHHLRQVVPRH